MADNLTAPATGAVLATVDIGGNIHVPLAIASLVTAPAKHSFTRPANVTAYDIGDLIANSTTAGSVTAGSWTGATFTGTTGGSGRLIGITLWFSGAVTEWKTVRVHLFSAAPTMTNGDGGAFAVTSFDLDTYLGYVDVEVNTVMAGGGVGYAACLIPYVLASTDTLYYRLEARTGFTPTNAGTVAARPSFERLS